LNLIEVLRRSVGKAFHLQMCGFLPAPSVQWRQAGGIVIELFCVQIDQSFAQGIWRRLSPIRQV
jgi:hypothetical protein